MRNFPKQVEVAVQEREYFADLAQRELEHRANGVEPGDVHRAFNLGLEHPFSMRMYLGSNQHGTRRVEGGTELINKGVQNQAQVNKSTQLRLRTRRRPARRSTCRQANQAHRRIARTKQHMISMDTTTYLATRRTLGMA